MNTRISYIDATKGLAILFVVMGHSIACQIPDFSSIVSDSDPSVTLVWHLIYCFHMPLLMFCSGLLFPRQCTFKSILKRAKTLLVPYVAMGIVQNFIMGGGIWNYWFLIVLFEFYIVCSIPCLLFSKFKNWHKIELFVYCGIAILVWLLTEKFQDKNYYPIIDTNHTKLIIFYVLGIVSNRLSLVEKFYDNQLVYSMSLVLFPLMFILRNYFSGILNGYVLSISGYILPLSAIIVIISFFRSLDDSHNRLYLILQKLGMYSLEIYLLHSFFLIKIHPLGKYYLSQSCLGNSWQGILLPQFIATLVLSVICIYCCFVAMNLIWKSSILSKVFLGRTHKRQ